MILICGEALIDLVPEPGDGGPGGPARFTAHPGGSPANTAVGLARLGTRTAFAGRLAREGFGPILREHLAGNGVDLRYAVDAPELASLAVVSLDERGRAEYVFYVEGTADWQWSAAELPAALPDDVTAVHAGSIALGKSPGADVLTDLLRRERGRRTVSVDPNVRPSLVGDRSAYLDRVRDWLTIADLVKVSDDDLAWLYPDIGWEQAARYWQAAGPSVVVVTRGANGSSAFLAGAGPDPEPVVRPGRQVDVVDTVGAGDSFSSGLLDWLDRHDRLGPGGLAALTPGEAGAALDFAATVAAVTCSRAGADPPRRDELPAGS